MAMKLCPTASRKGWRVSAIFPPTGLALLSLAILVLGLGDVRAQADNDAQMPPYKLVRSLQFVQDSVVRGDHSAGEMQRHLLTMVDTRLRAADAAVFDDQRNVDAVFVYAMSGGNPQTLIELLESDERQQFDPRLAEALTHYLAGDTGKARQQLRVLLPEFKESPIAAYLTLVTANVLATADENEALRLFDKARLLAPGTIVEESALRRAIHVASRVDRIEQAMDNAERYVRRFLHSPYASQFVDIFVHAIVTHSPQVDQQRMEYILSLMDVARQREIYLRMARMSTIAGKEQLALLAASRAEALSGNTKDIVTDLAGFYAGVASVQSGDITAAIKAIAVLPDNKLSKRDRALRDAARMVASQVTRAPVPVAIDFVPPVSAAGVEAGSMAVAEEALDVPVSPFDGFLTANRAALRDIDLLLDGNLDE